MIYPIVFLNDPVEIYINQRMSKMELSKIRKRNKMTQKDVSAMTGLSVQCISDIESESAGNPTLKSLVKYLNCFGYEICFQKKEVL